jgi:AbrB family looped-hinge helix DNA binding protein
MRDLTTLSSKGQVVIPKRLRDVAGLQSGDQLALEWNGEQLLLTKLNYENSKPSPSVVRELLGKYSVDGVDQQASVRTLRENLYGKIID